MSTRSGNFYEYPNGVLRNKYGIQDTSPQHLDLHIKIRSGTLPHTVSIELVFYVDSIPVKFAHGEKAYCGNVPDVGSIGNNGQVFYFTNIPESIDGYQCTYQRGTTSYQFIPPITYPLIFTNPVNGATIPRNTPLTITYIGRPMNSINLEGGNLFTNGGVPSANLLTPTATANEYIFNTFLDYSQTATGKFDVLPDQVIHGPGKISLTYTSFFNSKLTIFHSISMNDVNTSSIYVTWV